MGPRRRRCRRRSGRSDVRNLGVVASSDSASSVASSFLLPSLLLLLLAVPPPSSIRVHANNVATCDPPRARFFTVPEFVELLASESAVEFELRASDKLPNLTRSEREIRANGLWDRASLHEWERCCDFESRGNKACPFLVCDSEPDWSGARRKARLRDAYLGEDGGAVANVYNSDEKTCVFASARASVAAKIAGNRYSVQPFLMSMKMAPNTVDYMTAVVDELGRRRRTDGSNESPPRYPRVHIGICPGLDVGDPSRREQDLTEEMTAWLLERESRDNKTVSSVSKSMYWNETDANDPGITARIDFWADLFDASLNTDLCDDTFQTRLTWKLVQGLTNTSVDVLTVAFNTTDRTELDRKCAVAMVAGIAVLPEVCTVEIEEAIETQNTEAQWLIQSGIEDEVPWFDVGLDGTGQVVAVSDTGVDVDNCYFRDDGRSVTKNNRCDNDHRKIVQYRPFENFDDYKYGHGTHVVGTVAGRRSDGSKGMAEGVAKNAKIAFIDIGDDNGALRTPNDQNLLSTGRDFTCEPKASIHSASWGVPNNNRYTTQARNFDDYMHHYDDFLILVAAGNEGNKNGNVDNGSVGTPATAKNIISVGAGHSFGDDLSGGMLGPSYIADFSSRGPTADSRKKPDIIAPGKYILSAGALPSVNGECDPSSRPGAGSTSDGVASKAGTSMATPAAAASAAMVRQYFLEGYHVTGVKNASAGFDPSGGLVKAVLMNGAQEMRGIDDGGGDVIESKLYDEAQNFGRISLIDSVYVKSRSNVQIKAWDRQFISDGDALEYDVTVDKSNGCQSDVFSATLLWIEEGSNVGCQKCVLNDLDLYVTKNNNTSTKYYPNGRTSKEDWNNPERVRLTGANDGDTYTMHVVASNLANSYQKFVLVTTGCYGGVENLLATESNVFDNDTSEEDNDRRNTILIAVFSSLGGILALCLCYYMYKKHQAKKEDLVVEKGEPVPVVNEEGEPMVESTTKAESMHNEEYKA